MDTLAKRDIFVKMNKAIVTCEKCRLCKDRKHAVPGEGNINARIIFVGEAPGADEDTQGRPFVGRSGQFLSELMSKIGLDRRNVWIGNVIKCRPPENRDPMFDEVRACTPYLEKQIEMINPKVIVTLGRFALEYFIPKARISEAHGTPYRVKNRIVFPLYHPAAALRNDIIRKMLHEEFRKLKVVYNTSIEDVPYHPSFVTNAMDDDQKSLF